MTADRDFSAAELEVLAGARRALEPNAQDAARVLHNARLAIASGAGPSAGVTAGSASALAKKIALGLGIAGLSAWLGYGAGFSAGERGAREAVRMPAPAISAPRSSAAPASTMTSTPPSAPVLIETTVAITEGPKRPKASRPAAAAIAENNAPLAPEPSPSLDAEIKALRAIERALRNREPQRALELLAALDREVAEGQMLEERAAARAMARCEKGALSDSPDPAEAMQRVLEFSQAYPASVYFTRVRTTCLATGERDDATDSPPR